MRQRVTQGWIANVWKYTQEIGARIELNDEWVPTPQREGDKSIMDEISKKDLTTYEILTINRC